MWFCEVIRDLEDKLKRSQDKNSALEEEKSVLEDKNSALEEERSVWKDEISVLKEEVERLKKIEKEFEKFKAERGVVVGALRKALKIKADIKKRSKRGRGAPKGHKGGSFIVPAVSAVREHSLLNCPHCASKLEDKTVGTRSRYITDVEVVTPAITTKHVIPRKYCHSCKKIVEPKIVEALSRANIGINLMIRIFYLKVVQRSSFEQIKDYLKTNFNLEITKVGILGVLYQLKRVFRTYEKNLIRSFKDAKIKYTDSTGWRVGGKNYYAWILLSKPVAIYQIFKRNNHKGPLRLLGKKQEDNILVTDRHSACMKLAREAKMQSQYCWSHILQDSKELAQYYSDEGLKVHKTLKRIYKKAKKTEERYQSSELDDSKTQEAIQRLKDRITALTTPHYKSSRVRKFLKHIHERDLDNLFHFINTNADSTNNCSERALRPLVITRHISNGSTSLKGANTTMTLHTIYQTLKAQTNNFQNTNLHTELKQILTNQTQN